MIDKVEAFVERYHMIAEGNTVIAGVSGGADSVCLLRMLEALRKKYLFALRVVHVEHGIRGEESRRDAAFVRALCERLHVPFVQYNYEVERIAKERRLSVEEAGRLLRYEAFEREADRFAGGKIAVAHHKNDSAETLLYNLIRGSHVAGMAGIAPVRGKIIRPLLCLKRDEIEAYLGEIGQEYCIDATNLETVYTRNRLRQEVFPILQTLNPSAILHMAQAAETMREMQQYLDYSAEELLEDVTERHQGGVLLRTDDMKEVPTLLSTQVVYRVIAKLAGSKKDLTKSHVQEVWGLAGKQVGRYISLPYGLTARREYGGIWIGRDHTENTDSVQEILLEKCGDFYCRIIDNIEEIQDFPKKKYTKWLDYDKIKNSLCVRSRREGDYFYLKEDGHVKKLKQYFVDEKIPQEKRKEIALVADGSHIVWIVGYRISAYYKITERTRRILEIQYEKIPAGERETFPTEENGGGEDERECSRIDRGREAKSADC